MVVRGDTLQRKTKLKELGGRWNKALAGWVFPGSKRDKVVAALRAVPATTVSVEVNPEGAVKAEGVRRRKATAQHSPACGGGSCNAEKQAAMAAPHQTAPGRAFVLRPQHDYTEEFLAQVKAEGKTVAQVEAEVDGAVNEIRVANRDAGYAAAWARGESLVSYRQKKG